MKYTTKNWLWTIGFLLAATFLVCGLKLNKVGDSLPQEYSAVDPMSAESAEATWVGEAPPQYLVAYSITYDFGSRTATGAQWVPTYAWYRYQIEDSKVDPKEVLLRDLIKSLDPELLEGVNFDRPEKDRLFITAISGSAPRRAWTLDTKYLKNIREAEE